jgi:short-subunit dehydrogenase
MMKKDEKAYTLITGASKGLGKEIAYECARRGNNLILVALPGEDLKGFCRYLELKYKISASCYETDLTKNNAPLELTYWVKKNFSVNILINNAGVGGTIPFGECSADYMDKIILLNIRALTLITRQMLSELKKHSRAYILNVASLAAFSPIPFKTVYPASKAFVYSFSRGLQEELKGTSVRVSVLCPGQIMTNHDAEERIKRLGLLGRFGLLPADKIARIAISSLLNDKKIIIPGILSKVNLFIIKALPSGIRIHLFARLVRKEIKAKVVYKSVKLSQESVTQY